MDTAAKTVYAAVGSAGPGVIVGAGATESTCHAKNDLWLSSGALQILSEGSCLIQYVSAQYWTSYSQLSAGARFG